MGVASLAYVYDMALHDTATNHIGCDGEPGICIWYGLGTQETERSSMSHIDDVIGMMAYLEHILMAVTIGGGIVF